MHDYFTPRVHPGPIELAALIDRIARTALPIRRRLLLIVLRDLLGDMPPDDPDRAALLAAVDALQGGAQ